MDFQAEEITVQLTLHGGESLSLFRYNATGGVETSEELTEASEVTICQFPAVWMQRVRGRLQ